MTGARSTEPQLSRVADDDADFDRRPAALRQTRRPAPWWLALVALAAGAAALVWWWRPEQPPPPAEQPPVAAAAPPAAAPSEPAIRHPIAEVPKHAGLDESLAQPPAPALADSDAALRGALAAIPGAGAFERFVHPQDLVRRFVATVDNLPRAAVSTQVMAVKPVEGAFAVTGADGDRTIAAANAARYAPLLRFATDVDTKGAVALYVRFYPWFQQAYVDLGYPSGYFNDRLIDVIDHLLAAPDVAAPVAVVQPRVLHQFADPRLEALSAGRKIMVRMGSDNAALAKAKLREVRRALTGALPPP